MQISSCENSDAEESKGSYRISPPEGRRATRANISRTTRGKEEGSPMIPGNAQGNRGKKINEAKRAAHERFARGLIAIPRAYARFVLITIGTRDNENCRSTRVRGCASAQNARGTYTRAAATGPEIYIPYGSAITQFKGYGKG